MEIIEKIKSVYAYNREALKMTDIYILNEELKC